MSSETIFDNLRAYLARIPALDCRIGSGVEDDAIDIQHPLAWNVVQELSHVLNYLSLNERLPTVFMPVSPPPYMNGGPAEFLSWVIECKDKDFTPDDCATCLEGRLPRPVEDIEQWKDDAN